MKCSSGYDFTCGWTPGLLRYSGEVRSLFHALKRASWSVLRAGRTLRVQVRGPSVFKVRGHVSMIAIPILSVDGLVFVLVVDFLQP